MKIIGIFFIAAMVVFSVFTGPASAGGEKAGQAAGGDHVGQSAMTGDRTQLDEPSDRVGISDAEHLKTSDIIGKNIVSIQGEEIGSVEDLILGDNGRILYLILSRGGVLGLGDEFVPVPWKAAELRVEEDRLISSLDRQTLEDAPSFNSEEMAEFGNPEFEQEVKSFYGIQPEPDSEGTMEHEQKTETEIREAG